MRIAVVALAILVAMRLAAPARQSLAGDWVGGTNVLGSWNFTQMRVRASGQRLSGSLDIPSQDAMRLPLRGVALNGSEVRFDVDSPLGVFAFRGKLENGIIDGAISGPDGAKGKLHLVPSPALERRHYDKYVGGYALADGQRLIVTYRPFGQLFAILLGGGERPVIRRALNLIPVDTQTFFTSGSVNAAPKRDERVRFTGTGADARVEWPAAGGPPVTGVRERGGVRQEWVVVHNGPIVLNATLFLPPSPGSHAALVSVGGSGPTTRDNVFLRSLELARAGVAVLVYDKRGTGDESGDWSSATHDDLAADAAAALRYLRTRPDIDSLRLGLHGHSQGGWIAPLALARDAGVRFMILTSPSAQLPAEQEAYRAERQTANAGGSASDAAAAGALMRIKWSVAANPVMWDEYAAALRAARGARWLSIVKPPPTPDSPLWKDLRAQLATDPRPAMRRVLVPTLILFGATDDQVPPKASADGWRAFLSEAGNRDAQITEVPDVGHGIFTARLNGGAVVVPEPRGVIVRWLSSHRLIQ
jgi:hypothetical protein